MVRKITPTGCLTNFAISDVPPGGYVLGVEIEGKRVYRGVRVQAGKLTWGELRPAPEG